MMTRSVGLVCLLAAPQALAFDWGNIDRIACAELQKGNDKKAVVKNVCTEATKSFPFLRDECEAVVSKTIAALEKKCAKILPPTTTVTTTTLAPAEVFVDQLMSLFNGKLDKVEPKKLVNSGVEIGVVPLEVKDAADKAGMDLPTPHDIMCKGLSNVKMETRAEKAICRVVPPNLGNATTEACEKAVGFVWGQEAADLNCSGAPKPWWPFHFLHGLADKLICFELKEGRLKGKEKEITDKVCNELSGNRVERFTCEVTIKHFFETYEKKCAEMAREDAMQKLKLPQGADFLV